MRRGWIAMLALALAVCLLGAMSSGALAEETEEPLGSENDPENVWMAAMEVYSWFTIHPLDVDYEQPNADGTMWRVLDERFSTIGELTDYARFYLSDEIVLQLMMNGLYSEENGALYASDEGRMIDGAIENVELDLAEDGDERTVLNVTVTYADGVTEQLVFVRALIGGGWRYTEFPFFW